MEFTRKIHQVLVMPRCVVSRMSSLSVNGAAVRYLNVRLKIDRENSRVTWSNNEARKLN